MTLLESGALRQERGDVVLFNNTSCEHPGTYAFVAECKERTEAARIPFFLIEFQTFEDASKGEWSRFPTYRLVNARPLSDENPDGFRWHGEVFEEHLSHKGFVPNQFRRTCTKSLKIEVTRRFLRDWLGAQEGIPAEGHGGTESLVDRDQLYARHGRGGGSTPRVIFDRKKDFVLARPANRPAQRYTDYSPAATPFSNRSVRDRVFGGRAHLGIGAVEYVSLIGLRGDEPHRVARVSARAANSHADAWSEGEHPYMPLADLKIDESAVAAFWSERPWGPDLLPADRSLSNCVFCFLKGVNTLARIEASAVRGPGRSSAFGTIEGTPCDVGWWIAMERKYGRDLKQEERAKGGFIGFFGNRPFSFAELRERSRGGDGFEDHTDTLGPCECTD